MSMSDRWKILRDPEKDSGPRWCAGLELVCFPLSSLTILGLIAQIIAVKCGWTAPRWLNSTLAVLVSAAVGYITNYIAIEMLFRPYDEKKWFPLWRQGLIPRNKKKIGEELGNQVATKLLDPEEIAGELCDMVTSAIHDPDVINKLRDTVQSLLKDNMTKITGFLIPKLEEEVLAELARLLTPENAADFWQHHLAPKLNEEQNRILIANTIVDGLKRRSPELTRMLREGLREYAQKYLEKKIPGGIGAETLANGLVAAVDWPAIQVKMREKIGEADTRDMIRDEIRTLAGKLDEWLKTDEGKQKLAAWTGEFQAKFRGWLQTYLREKLPGIAERMLGDDSELWRWIESTLLPAAEPKIRDFIASQKDKIIEKLAIKKRITDAIDKQDVRQFHEMINSIAAQHLGAIQVLGYFLGLLVGFLQLLR